MTIRKRIARLEAGSPEVPTHEAALFAFDRLTNPPREYPAELRASDEDVVSRHTRALVAAGLD